MTTASDTTPGVHRAADSVERARRRRRADVVVVGSGIAGTSAALHAARAGARVVLVEKADSPGGSAALSAGMFWTAPDPEAYNRRIPLGKPGHGAALVRDYPEAVEELRQLGVRVAEEPTRDIMTFGIGYSTDIHGILEACRGEVLSRGGEILTGTPMVGLVTDQAGTGSGVRGVTVRRPDGGLLEIEAGAVVLATGGFQGDPEALTRYLGPSADQLLLRSNPGSVGDGLWVGRRAGAGSSKGMATFYGHLVPWPVHSFGAEQFLPYSQYYSGHAVLVNLRGERFSDETLGDELLNQDLAFQPQARGVLIFDDHVRRTEATQEPFPGLGAVDRFATAVGAGGRHHTADTLDELLDAVAGWGVDRVNLGTTLAAYADAVVRGGGPALGIPVAPGARAPQSAPFHALMVQPSITFTFGGLPTNTDGEVLDPDGCPVPRLLAAGADLGGLSNYGYAGGLAPGYITGRWASRTAARTGTLHPHHEQRKHP